MYVISLLIHIKILVTIFLFAYLFACFFFFFFFFYLNHFCCLLSLCFGLFLWCWFWSLAVFSWLRMGHWKWVGVDDCGPTAWYPGWDISLGKSWCYYFYLWGRIETRGWSDSKIVIIQLPVFLDRSICHLSISPTASKILRLFYFFSLCPCMTCFFFDSSLICF